MLRTIQIIAAFYVATILVLRLTVYVDVALPVWLNFLLAASSIVLLLATTCQVRRA